MLQRHRCLLTAPSLRHMTLAMATLLLIAVTAAFSLVSWHREQQEQLRLQQSLVEIGAPALDAYFLGLERGLTQLSEQVMRLPAPRQATPLLEDFKRRHPELHIAVLIHPEGQILASSEGPDFKLPDLSKNDTFIEAKQRMEKGENLVISHVLRGPVSGKLTMPVRLAVRDKAGRLVYMVGIGLPLAKALSFWNDAPMPSGWAMGLIRDDGYLVARHPPANRKSPDEIYFRPSVGALIHYLREHNFPLRGVVTGIGSVTLDSPGASLVFRRLEHYPLTFYSRSPREHLIAAWWDDVWFTYALLGLMFAGSVAIYAWSAARQSRWDEERSQRIEQLERANQELASFTYAISHDLRAPLRAVDGYAALQMEELSATHPQIDQGLLARVRDSATRMGKLIDGLLEFSRQSQMALDIRRVDLNELVQSVLREKIPAGSTVQVDVGPLPDRHGDAAMLRRVWKSLIGNALKYSAHARAPRIEIGFEDGAYFVRDNGAGFDMAHAAKLFAVFSRLHHTTEFDGTGVNLAIVRRIVERHGGRIWASGTPGQGAEFRFVLDAAEGRA